MPHHRARLALSLLAAACLAAGLPAAQSQDLGGRNTAAQVPRSELDAALARLATAQARVAALEAERKARDDDLARQRSRADQAEKALKDAANRSAGASPEQLAALQRERDAALKERDAAQQRAADLNQQLADSRDKLKAAQPAAGELRKAEAELAVANRLVASLRGQVQALQKQVNQDAAAPLAASPPAANPLADKAELSVAGCGAACPSFIVIPHLSKVTLGQGNDAVVADIRHRFAMGKTEVTVRQWKAFVTESGYKQAPSSEHDTCKWTEAATSDDHPVACVNAFDAQAYADWFSHRYRSRLGVAIEAVGLPSELEWAVAARGGRLTQVHVWDDDKDACRHAQIAMCEGAVKPAAGRLPNGYGLHDMIGNLWEWTASPYRAASDVPANGREPPPVAALGAWRAVRGASFNYVGDRVRLSDRSGWPAGYRYGDIGFRLVARIAP